MFIQTDEDRAFWQNPDNWRYYVFYVCREDPRLIVPKRFRVTGWTMNFAHPQAYLLLVLLLVIVIAPVMVIEASGLNLTSWVRPVTVVLSILAAVALTWWASRLRVK